MRIKKGTLRAKLSSMKAQASPLERNVLQWLMDSGETDEEIKSTWKDLMHHGCVSGMVSHLIYYADTLPFAKQNIEEILEMLEEIEDNHGEPLKKSSPLLNWYAWFGFEEVAHRLADKLELLDEFDS